MRLARRWPVAFFLAAALLITYVLGPLAYLGLRAAQRAMGTSVPGVNELVMKFGPSLAGLLTVALLSGRAGVRDLLQRAARARFSLALYLFALLVPALVLAVVLVARGHAAELANVSPAAALQVFGLQLVLAALFGGGLGEELGWRGFLRPRLEAARSPLAASLWVALAWWAWHLPAYALFGKGEEDPFLPFAVIMIPWSIALSWITVRSGSLLAPVLLHGSLNAASYTMIDLLPGVVAKTGFQPGFDGSVAAAWCVVALAVVAVAGSHLGSTKEHQ